MEKKLNNLLDFGEFKSGWKAIQATKTKRTETGLDILKEGLEDDGITEIIPEGLPEDDSNFAKYGKTGDSVQEIIDALDDLDEVFIDEIINYLRDVLLDMEQDGLVDEETTDKLDDENGEDWIEWIKAAIQLPDFPEDVLNGILDIITVIPEDLDDDVECPDCGGTGEDEDGECERCEGTGRVLNNFIQINEK